MADENTRGRARRGRRGRRLSPRSPLWNLPDGFDRIEDPDGNLLKAVCRRCGQEYGPKSGGNLNKHYKRLCPGREAAASARAAPPLEPPGARSLEHEPVLEQEEAAAPANMGAARPPAPSPYAPSRFGESSGGKPVGLEDASKHLARMVALGGYDSSVVEDDYFRSFVASLHPEFQVPSRVDIEEMCNGIFNEARKDLFSKLRRTTGRISLAVGTGRTTEGEKVVYVACHFIDDEWNLQKMVLDAYVVVDDWREHVVNKVIVDIENCSNKLFMMAWDKAGCGSDLHMKRLEPHPYPVNRELICTTYADNMLRSIAQSLIKCSGYILHAFYNISSTRQKRQQLLPDLELHYHQLWYYYYCYWEVLREDGYSSDESPSIKDLLCEIWEVIHCAIKKISTSSCPTSHLCLEGLFKVREILQSALEKASGDDAQEYDDDKKDFADCLREAKDTLDKAIKDSYIVWFVPHVLDPRSKFTHIDSMFTSAFGSEAADMISRMNYQIKMLFTDHGPEAELEELNSYIKDPLVSSTEGFDILNWWEDHSCQYPTVAQMARNALAMPASSILSSEQIAHVRSLVRGYSNEKYKE